MDKKFTRNLPSLSAQEQELIGTKKIVIVGCGGLGGFLAEYAVRIGFKHITLVDPDVFDVTNMNRQICATDATLGKTKVFVEEERIRSIHPDVEVRCWRTAFDDSIAVSLLRGKDLVFDALDNLEARLQLEDGCASAGIPLVYGAIVGWKAQVMLSMPGSQSIRHFYQNNELSVSKTSIAFTPAICAGLQMAQAVRYLCGKNCSVVNKVLLFDTASLETRIIDPSEKVLKVDKIRITVRQWAGDIEEIIDERTTIGFLLKKLELTSVSVLRNGVSVPESDFDKPLIEDGDVISFHYEAGVSG